MVNSNGSLLLDGYVSAKYYGIYALWSIFNDDNMEITNWVASTSKERRFIETDFNKDNNKDNYNNNNNLQQQLINFPLSIDYLDSSIFIAGSYFTFRLEAYQYLNTTNKNHNEKRNHVYNEIKIYINSPPLNGKIIISPLQGLAFLDEFIIITSDWIDDINNNLPLNYEFLHSLDDVKLLSSSSFSPSSSSLSSSSSSYNMLQVKSSSNQVITDFPAGLSTFNYNVVILCNIYDVYLASSSINTKVIVKNNNSNHYYNSSNSGMRSALNLTKQLNYYQRIKINSALKTFNSDLITRTINNIAIDMNIHKCNLVTDNYCNNILHRYSCSL